MLSSINLDQIIWVDAVVIAALVLSFGLGIFRGFVREVLSLSFTKARLSLTTHTVCIPGRVYCIPGYPFF